MAEKAEENTLVDAMIAELHRQQIAGALSFQRIERAGDKVHVEGDLDLAALEKAIRLWAMEDADDYEGDDEDD